jgi:hypothetical protein
VNVPIRTDIYSRLAGGRQARKEVCADGQNSIKEKKSVFNDLLDECFLDGNKTKTQLIEKTVLPLDSIDPLDRRKLRHLAAILESILSTTMFSVLLDRPWYSSFPESLENITFSPSTTTTPSDIDNTISDNEPNADIAVVKPIPEEKADLSEPSEPPKSTADVAVLPERKSTIAAKDVEPQPPPAPSQKSVQPEADAEPDLDEIIEKASQTYNVESSFIRAVIKAESDFNTQAVSPKGAMGLMQLMPATAKDLGVADPHDPVENVMGGTRYLQILLKRYSGDKNMALAAYNWGMGNLERHPEKMPQETKTYIGRVNNYLKTFSV